MPERPPSSSPSHRKVNGLTALELKVANLFAHGMRVNVIAHCLSLNQRLIEFHLAVAYRKMALSPDSSARTPQRKREMRDWLIERGLLVDRSGPEALLTRAIRAIETLPSPTGSLSRQESEMLEEWLADSKAKFAEAFKAMQRDPQN